MRQLHYVFCVLSFSFFHSLFFFFYYFFFAAFLFFSVPFLSSSSPFFCSLFIFSHFYSLSCLSPCYFLPPSYLYLSILPFVIHLSFYLPTHALSLSYPIPAFPSCFSSHSFYFPRICSLHSFSIVSSFSTSLEFRFLSLVALRISFIPLFINSIYVSYSYLFIYFPLYIYFIYFYVVQSALHLSSFFVLSI